MREILTFTPEQILPSESTLLRDQGLPDRARLSARLAAGFDEAVGLFRALAEPRAVVQEVERSLVESILEEAGPLEERPVVGRILDKAGACALYVATLGEPVSERIRGLFAEHDLALGWTLDSVASSAADRLGELLATRFRDALVGRGAVDPRVLPYSPGYCGWPTRGQGSLFEEIEPSLHRRPSDGQLPDASREVGLGSTSRGRQPDTSLRVRLRFLRHVHDTRV